MPTFVLPQPILLTKSSFFLPPSDSKTASDAEVSFLLLTSLSSFSSYLNRKHAGERGSERDQEDGTESEFIVQRNPIPLCARSQKGYPSNP